MASEFAMVPFDVLNAEKIDEIAGNIFATNAHCTSAEKAEIDTLGDTIAAKVKDLDAKIAVLESKLASLRVKSTPILTTASTSTTTISTLQGECNKLKNA